MKPTRLLTTTTAAAAATAALSALHPLTPSAQCADAPPARPNIVIFLTDDQSWDTTSFNGSPDMPTPNMKRLSEAGMTFNRAYVASPSCAPSRAALLTGLYPIRNGAMFNHQYPELTRKKWPDYLKEQGYEVVALGKVAHYAQVLRYNFDYSADFNYANRIFADNAIDWLKNRQNTPGKSQKPLCMLIGSNWPHVPWPDKGIIDPDKVHLPPQLVDTPETRRAWSRYAAAVNNADTDLGKIYDAARKHLGNDTLFLFTADHGAQFPFHKWNCYNGGLRTPLVVSWPGRVAPNTRTEAMVSWIDILPTILEAIGATPPPVGPAKNQIDGRSFLPVLLGKTNTHRDLIHGTHSGDGNMNEYPMRTVIGPRYKYIRNLAPDTEFHSHVDKAPEAKNSYWPSWPEKAKTDPAAAVTVARYFKRPPEELYDLQTDPNDLVNLATDPAHTATLAEYRAKLDEWMTANGDKGLPTEKQFKAAKIRDDAKNKDLKADNPGKNKAKNKAKNKTNN